MKNVHLSALRSAVVATLLLLAAAGLAAESAKPPAKPKPPPVKPERTPAEPKRSPAAPTPLREQTIYVPYKKLHEVFEKKGRGVFLPYEEFRQLWEAARAKAPKPADVKPPVDSVISELSAVATVAKEVVTVKADLKIEALKQGWQTVALRLSDVALTSATLDGKPARVVFQQGEGYRLLLEKVGDQPKPYRLVLEFVKAYTKAPGQNSVSIETPPAPVSRWDVWIPEPGVKVNIRPLLAAAEAPVEKGAQKTHVQAFVGAASTVRIEWTPKAEGATGLAALAAVRAEQQMSIEDGVTRTRAELHYQITRAELSKLSVQVPKDQKVVNVFDPNVREWSVAPAGAAQTIAIQLFEPAKDAQELVVELETFAGEGGRRVAAPVVQALDVGRQQGVVVVRVAPGLRAEAVERNGLLQVDKADLPAALAGREWDFACRYAAVPFGLAFSVEKINPRVLVDALVEARLAPEGLTLELLALYDVQRAGIFRLEMAIPAGFDVRHVAGVAIGDAAPARIDTHHTEGDPQTTLVVNLSRKALGRVGVEVRLHRALSEPNLLTPTGAAARIPLPVPRARSVEREKGRLVVYAPVSLRVNPTESVGLRVVSYKEAIQDMRKTKRADARPVLCFAYSDDEVKLQLGAERRKPHVTVRQLLAARIESGVVKYEATFHCDILYSSVKSLRIDVPAALAKDQIRIATPGVTYEAIEAADLAPAEGCVAWGLKRDAELIGAAEIRMTWEEKIAELDTGKSVELAVPRLIPRQVDRAWGQIVLAKAETIDVAPADDRQGLRPIDPRHDLMPGANVPGAAQAFEFHDDWSLAVKVTRYDLKEVKATSIERAVVRTVVTRSKLTSLQAMYRMRSVRQRLTIRFPANVEFDTQPVRINGRPVSLEQGDEEYYVPLTGQNPDKPFLLELRAVVKGAGLKLQCPTFPNEPATQQVFLAVYLPREKKFLGALGPWHDELHWPFPGFGTRPRARRNQDWLLDWVTEGVAADHASLTTFPVDGRLLLFSTLHPPPDEQGALRVVAVSAWLLKGLVWLIVLGGGLALLRARCAARALAFGGFVVGIAFFAVFLPTLTRQMAGGAMFAAVFVVLVVWLFWHLLVVRPQTQEHGARIGGWVPGRSGHTARVPPQPLGPPPPAPSGEVDHTVKISEVDGAEEAPGQESGESEADESAAADKAPGQDAAEAPDKPEAAPAGAEAGPRERPAAADQSGGPPQDEPDAGAGGDAGRESEDEDDASDERDADKESGGGDKDA